MENIQETTRTKSTLWLTLEQQERLRAIARDFGYVVDRGRAFGEGSIPQLIHAIADGIINLPVMASKE